jgi:hypothetical protein
VLHTAAQLPGAGLICVDSISAAAFVGSVVAAAPDPVLLLHVDGLTRSAQPVLARLQTPAAIVLQLPLSHPFFLLTQLEFVSWFRFQFRIPQLARIANANAEGIEQCIAGCRDRNVDLHGNRALRPL